MRIEDIEIFTDAAVGRPYRELGPIKARVAAATLFSRARTLDEVNQKLREVAARMGANAVINVMYDRGISAMSWKALTAYGTAVVTETDEKQCPFCAETIKRSAKVCRFCGRDLPQDTAAAPGTSPPLPDFNESQGPDR